MEDLLLGGDLLLREGGGSDTRGRICCNKYTGPIVI